MIRSKNIVVLLLCAVIFTISCEKVVDFRGQLPQNKIVLNGFVEAGEKIKISVSRSWDIMESTWTVPPTLEGVEVLLYVNGVLKERMQEVALPEGSYSGDYYSYISDVIADTGDIVELIAKKDGYQDVSSSTVVPPKAVIISVDSVSIVDQNYSDAMRVFIKFKDIEPDKRNYYRLVVESLPDENRSYHESVRFNYEKDIAMNSGYEDSGTGELVGLGKAENVYHIFDDEIFNGGEYVLNISFIPQYSHKVVIDGTVLSEYTSKYCFRLVTLSEESYRYLKSMTDYENGEDTNIFVEPDMIFSNVINGLGIFAAFQKDEIIIEMPEKEVTFGI